MDVRAEISSVITDPDRAAEVLGIVDELETSFLAVRTNVQERRAKLRALNADYDATKEDFMALYDEARADMKSNGRTITAIHRRLVDSMTADEWDKVNKTQSKALNAALKSYRSI